MVDEASRGGSAVTFPLRDRVGLARVPHMGSAHPAVLRPALSLATVGWGSGLALAASALTGAVVAWRVTRLKPVEASRG